MKKSLLLACLALVPSLPLAAAADPANTVVLDIGPSREFPRNSEGAFATLKSGRILFCYSQFYGGSDDDSPARIVEVHSDDQGRSWSQSRLLVDNGRVRNVMSVSLLRLASGKLALFYAIKANRWGDCHPYLRTSIDEGATWSEARRLIAAPGFFVINNDRVIQTRTGRLILPVAYHRSRGAEDAIASLDFHGIALWYLSDDEGASWREADTWWALPVASQTGLQEPGVVELADGSLFSWARTDQGRQYGFRSEDNGRTWTAPTPTELQSPASPASIKRLPNSDALLAVYNDTSQHAAPAPGASPYGGRTPLAAAISRDGGRTWPLRHRLEDNPAGRYCYTAIHFVGDAVLLAYSTGVNPDPAYRWGELRIRRIALTWLEAPAAASR